MSYTMLNQPKQAIEDLKKNSLSYTALAFVREKCEGLRFDQTRKSSIDDKKTWDFDGGSLKRNQIPYNMEKDIDRLCLEKSIEQFLESGKKEDAFNVYFCYLDMFVGNYDKTRKMIELLSEFEANGSGLLMKHRDHYSHSVYVFILGLAIYQSSTYYREVYKTYYHLKDEREAGCHYLKYWGLASLFHDIGYPFELPFEQVASYFEVDGDDRAKRPFVSYQGLESFVTLSKSMQRNLAKIYGLDTDKMLKTTNELFAFDLYQKLGKKYYFSEEEMLKCLIDKPAEPNKFGHFMDHAYFSATILYKKLFEELKLEVSKEYVDSITAILLHNSLYKFSIAYYKDAVSNIRFKAELHPLAYMLMLCDELQCWDRTAYGRNSKLELHPMDCEFDFSENKIKATYVFDSSEQVKMKNFDLEYEEWKETRKGKQPKLKAYSSMVIEEDIIRDDKTKATVNDFQADIERIVDLSNLKLEVSCIKKEKFAEKKKTYLSDCRFIKLFDFAIVLNGVWENVEDWKKAKTEGKEEEFVLQKNRLKTLKESFCNLSLEYQLFNINQAKAFSKYMNEIGCFYTDRDVDFELLQAFSSRDTVKIGVMEHRRWLQEHYDMGWKYLSKEDLTNLVKTETGLEEGSKEFKIALLNKREQLRCHWDMLDYDVKNKNITMEEAKEHYHTLSKEEQDKDTDPMDCMLTLLKLFDGLRIYKL